MKKSDNTKTYPMAMQLKCLVPALFLITSFAGNISGQSVSFTATEITCHGADDGTMKMTRSGGTSTYWYVYVNLTDPAQSDSFGPTAIMEHTFTNLPSDNLLVFYLRDAVSGVYIGSYVKTYADKAELFANVSRTNINCFGASTGTITINGVSGGSGQFDYTINGGASWQPTGNYNGLSAGTYNVQIRDRNNPSCIKILNPALVISQNPQLNASLSFSNPTCFNSDNGSITISSPSGGSGSGYQYTITGAAPWSAGGSYTSLAPGTYNVVMRDLAIPTCTRTLNGALVLTEPAQLTVSVSIKKGLTCYEGSDAQLQANVSGGTGPYTYDWYIFNSGWVSINQHTPVATNLARGRYQVRVNDVNSCGPATAGIFFIEGPAPGFAGDSIPPRFYYDGATAVTTCQGQTNGSIDMSAHGGVKPYTFSITTGGASGYQADSLFTGLAAGSYQPWVMDDRGCKKTGADVVVGTTPSSPVSVSIAANPSGNICPGTNVLFTATPVNGGTAPAYQWRLNGSPVGSNQPTYSNSALANGAQVNVVLTSDLRCATGNPATSNTITIVHNPVTSITAQPLPATQCEGTNVTFSVTATGVNRTYQWRKNGVDIPGATNSSYTINNINSSHAGNYSVRVHSDCGTDVTSNNALLTVNPATSITTQPAPLVQCAGTNATFTVVANGTVLTYQWRKNGANIPGANSASYTINNIAAADAGNYSVLVHGNCGADVISNNASLTVNPVTTITAQPVSLTQCQGTNATFSVTATGTNLTYQWRKDGVNIPGAVSANYTINNVNPSHNGNYSVTVTGDCGPARISNNALLTVNPATNISVQPQPVTQCEGTNATFTVTAQGTNLTYQWRKNAVDIPGATASSYTINNINSTHAGIYSVRVHGDCGADVISNNASLTVNTVTVITVQPVPVTQCQGTNATFSVTATGTNLTYQWRKDGVNIPGAVSANYTINNVNPTHNGNYSVTVTGTCGAAVVSDNARLTVNPATSISVQPQPVTQCEGTNATFTVTAQGTNLTYQWRKNGADIPGANGSSYTITGINSSHAGNYSVRVHGDCGADVISNAVALTVNPATSISAHPVALTQCAGTDAIFRVTAAGTSLTYQWMRNGVDIPGATASTYSITNINATHAGNYSVRVHGGCGADVVSNNALLTVNPLTAISIQPSPLSQCEGTNATFTVTAIGTNLTYQWRKNGVPIPGGTNDWFTIMIIDETDEGSYSVVVTGDCGAAVVSTAVNLTVNPPTAITVQPVSLIQCAGTNATFTVTAQGTSLTYQWRKNGVDIAGATSSSYTINNINASHAGNYTVRVHGNCGVDVVSNIAVLALHPATAITTQPAGSTECAGNSYTFTVDADGANLSYQWRKNGINIPGATGDSYTILNISAGDAGTYTVVVTGTCGSATSQPAVLTVNTVPVITGHPSNSTLCAGSDHSFTVSATGQGLTYLWRKNGVPIFPAETNPTLILNNIDAADAGSYDVVVTNACGDATSNAAVLTVAAIPVITQQPGDLDLCEGGNVTFSINATGTGLTYQWRKDGVPLAGRTSDDMTITGVSVSDAGQYDVYVYGMCDTILSTPAELIVYPATTADIVEDDTLVCEGSTVEFNVNAGGFGALTYQWQLYYYGAWIDLVDNSKYSGTNTPQLTVTNAEAPDSGEYRCVVFAGCGPVNSEPVRLDVNVIIATIGTPAPFIINSATTDIEVGIRVDNHFLIFDLGFALVAPDGTEVMLKSPIPDPCVYSSPVDINARFNNSLPAADSMDYCVPSSNITGTFGAAGDWSVLNGMDPSNGAWQIRVYDQDKSVADPDGYLIAATLTFTDVDNNGDTAVVTYNSGVISEEILNPIASELRPTSYIVPIRLSTSCFNTEDARAVVTVQGGVAPYTYEWSGPTPEADEAEADLGPGTYTVTVTDAIGCSAQATVEVTAPASIVFDDVRSTDTIICHGAAEGEIRAKASGGSGSIVYTLLPGNLPSSVADSGVFTGLTAGIYTLRATDLNGCMLDTIIRINEHPALVLTIATVPVIGDEKGNISISVTGGVAPYQYSIDNGATLQNNGDFSDLDAGVYPIYVVDAAGCFVTDQVNLNVELLNVDVTVHNISCYGMADGSFYLALVDGTGPYTLTGSFTDTMTIDDGAFSFTGQTAGVYDVKIEDSEGRVFIDLIQIIEPSEIVANAVITDATCNYNSNDGAIDITVNGGTGGYSFEWSNGDTIEDLTGIEAGFYSVIISDAVGCETQVAATVHAVTELPLDFLPDDVWACADRPRLFIGVDADSLRWGPAELFTDPNNIETYATFDEETNITLTIFDDSGCSVTDISHVNIIPLLGVDIWEKDGEEPLGEIVYLNEGESLALEVHGGMGYLSTYEWSPNQWINFTDSSDVIVSPQQNITYTVTVTTSCPEKDSVQIVLRRPLNIYNAFSPNGDGVNDTWVIEHAIEYGDKINVKIFNRWGEPVFESRGYGGSNEWDGNRNGKMMPVGSYYYIINVKDGKSKPYTGTVTLLR